MATGGDVIHEVPKDSETAVIIDVITQSVVQELPNAVDSDTVQLAVADQEGYHLQNGVLVFESDENDSEEQVLDEQAVDEEGLEVPEVPLPQPAPTLAGPSNQVNVSRSCVSRSERKRGASTTPRSVRTTPRSVATTARSSAVFEMIRRTEREDELHELKKMKLQLEIQILKKQLNEPAN